MASISRSKDKGTRIGFSINGQRKSFRPGKKVSDKDAMFIKGHVEEILLAQSQIRDVNDATLNWLNEISDIMHRKISRTGLIEPRESNNPFVGIPTIPGLQGKVRDLQFELKKLNREMAELMDCTRIEIREVSKA